LIQRDASGNISARVSTTGVTVAGSDGVSAQINIFNRSQHHVAPEAVSMEISVEGFATQGPASGAVYNPQYHELYYFWDFGENYRFSAPENLIDAHKNSGVAYGPKVSHTYRIPGTYTVSCLVVEPASGRSTTAVLEVIVADPNTVFAGLNTVFVSPSSDFSNAPDGARGARSLEEAFGLIGGTGLAPKRIMLNRGEIFAYGGRWFGLDYESSLPSTHVVAGPGNGANPRVVMSGGIAWNDKATSGNGADKDFIWQNIDLEGPWDSVSETGSNVTAFTHFDRPPRLQLFDGCSFDGFEIAFYAANNDPNIAHRFVAMNDCAITNWRSYGVLYGVGVGLALTGTKIACHPQASVGGSQDGLHNEQGPLRFHVGDNLLISNCDFFNRIGWSKVGSFQSIQPCVRQNVSGKPGFFSNIQASSFEGGAGVVEYTVEAGLTPGPINAVLEKCYLLANHQSWGGVRSQMAGLTVRNNIIVFPSASRDATIIDPFGFVEMAYQSGGSAEAYSAPVRVHNNTYVNLMQPDDYLGESFAITEFAAASQFSNARSDNNLIYQPNTGMTADGPLETSPVLWTPREAGYQTRRQGLIVSTATAHDTVATFRPQAGSDALGDALNGDVAYDDFLGNQRPQYAARGARETQ
jgi:hypothetical protein